MLERAPGSLFTGSVAIETEHQVLAHPKQGFNLPIIDRGAQGRDRGSYAVFGERDDIHITLGDVNTIDIGDRFFQLIQPVNFIAFMKQR